MSNSYETASLRGYEHGHNMYVQRRGSGIFGDQWEGYGWLDQQLIDELNELWEQKKTRDQEDKEAG